MLVNRLLVLVVNPPLVRTDADLASTQFRMRLEVVTLQQMSALAVGLRGGAFTSNHPDLASADILLVSDCFQMLRIDAVSDAAKVIQL